MCFRSDLVTPIASRGNVVAWGEQSGPSSAWSHTRARRWIVATMPRCTTKGCYRLGDVTVAKDGIVFTRDAVGGQGSFVVRRAFGQSKVQSVAVHARSSARPRPSSSGALYYVLFRGWYRWDFGASGPRPVSFANHPARQLILHEGSRWYWLVRKATAAFGSSRAGAGMARHSTSRRGWRLSDEASGGRAPSSVSSPWPATHAIASWAIASEAAEEDHSDAGLRGLVVSARVSPK